MLRYKTDRNWFRCLL